MLGSKWYRNPWIRALIYIALFLLLIPLLLAYRIANINPNAKLREYNTSESPLPSTAQVLSFHTADNLSIKGLYAASQRGKRLVIIIHGFGLTHKDMVKRGLILYPDVADVCFIDLRNHGLSEGSNTTFGYHEALDVQAVVRHFRSRYDEIIAWGSSMGAAAAVRAVVLGSSVDMLILEGLYDDLSNAITIQARRYYIPRFPFVLISLLLYPYLSGVDLSSMDMCANLRKLRETPILLVHSTADEEIPMPSFYSLKEALVNNNNGKTLLLDKGGHVSIYEANMLRYRKRVLDFVLNKM